MPTIPVIVDDTRRLDDLPTTRCRYYSIGCTDPTAAWFTTSEGKTFRFMLLGLSGIIYKPLGRARLFLSSDRIEALFEAIETASELFVDANHVWIPSVVLAQTPRSEPARGEVWRISDELFRMAERYANDEIDAKHYHSACHELRNPATLSAKETAAFSAWSREQVEAARRHYREHPRWALSRVRPAGPGA
ncbi:hypothetical protein ACFL59_03695 [Planctomycetota bacterium]